MQFEYHAASALSIETWKMRKKRRTTSTTDYYIVMAMPVQHRYFDMTVLVYKSWLPSAPPTRPIAYGAAPVIQEEGRPLNAPMGSFALTAVFLRVYVLACPPQARYPDRPRADFTAGLASRTRRGGPYPVQRANAPRQRRRSLAL